MWLLGAGLAWGLPFPARAQEGVKSETVVIPGTDVQFDMVRLPGGRFKMGSPANEPGRDGDEGEVRDMELKPLWMGKHEVTWREFDLYYETPKGAEVDGVTRPTRGREFLGQAGLQAHFQEARRPAICLRYYSAMGYCHLVSRKTGHLYRLPTEVEWEYACRAGGKAPAPAPLDDHAQFKDNSQDRTHIAGEKKPNAFGLHDMLGNAWEYCIEGRGPTILAPVLRGGAWCTPSKELRAANRKGVPLDWFAQDPNRPRSVWWLTGDFSQGFRMVRVADASDSKDREDYASKIGITIRKSAERDVKVGASAESYCRVWGEVKNGGDRALDELHLQVYYLTPKGKPHLADVIGANKPGQATFAYVFPVLVNSAYKGERRRPMKPGETRAFMADIPLSFDGEDDVDTGKFGGRTIGIVFARD